MSLVDTSSPAGQATAQEDHPEMGGKSLKILAEQGILVVEDSGSEQDSQAFESGSEAGSSDHDDDDDEESRDQTIMNFLYANPRIIEKMLSEGKYSLENVMKQNPSIIVGLIGQNYEDFAEHFAAQPQTINKILDEEACLLHNFLQENQQAFTHYLQVKPQALATYYAEHPSELNRLFYKDPSILSSFCDDHPSFMASWLQHRQATVQQYLVDNPALMWNHLRAHPAYRTGGQAWNREFTMGLTIDIPEEQEHLIREAIQWVLPKDRKRRLEKLAEMAARGEDIVAVRGTKAGQDFIDSDMVLEENETLMLSVEEADYLEGNANAVRPDRLNWYKGRNEVVEKHGITNEYQALAVEKPTPHTKIGPYQQAKSHIFKELHKSLQQQGVDGIEDETHGNQITASNQDFSEDEHIDTHSNSSDSDEDRSPSQLSPTTSAESDGFSDESSQNPGSSDSDSESDVPLMVRRNRQAHKQVQSGEDDYNDDLLGVAEDSDSDNASDTETSGHHSSSQKRLPGSKSYKGIQGVDIGSERLPTQVPSEEKESDIEESQHTADDSSDEAEDPDFNMDDEAPDRALIEYPASPGLIEASKLEEPSGKWRLFEEDIAIRHMMQIRDEKKIKGEARFREAQRRLGMDGIHRTWYAVKNFWNRTGRARSGFDERKNKRAPLATSKQGKAAEAKRAKKGAIKKKDSATPAQALSTVSAPQPGSSKTTRSKTCKKSASSKKPMTPDTTPEIANNLLDTENRSTETPQAEKTFNIVEIEKMKAELAAQQADFQAKCHEEFLARHAQDRLEMQKEFDAKLQAQIELSKQHEAAQSQMFKDAIAAITNTTDRMSSQSNRHEPTGKKRTRGESDNEVDDHGSEEPAYKKQQSAPNHADNGPTRDFRGTDKRGAHKWPVRRRDTPPNGYDYLSSQETQPGDRARNQDGRRGSQFSSKSHSSQFITARNQGGGRSGHNFGSYHISSSYRALRAGVRDRSHRPAPQYR